MISVNFPRMFDSRQTILTDDYTATALSLKLLLASEKGELRCDPYYGTHLKKYLYEKGDQLLKDLVIDDIYTAIKSFMPLVMVLREDIFVRIKDRDVYCTISYMTRAGYKVDLLDINLTTQEEVISELG